MRAETGVHNEAKLAIGFGGGTALELSVVNPTSPVVKIVPPVYFSDQADFEFSPTSENYPRPRVRGMRSIIMYSSTAGSTKQFEITVNDDGQLSATEVT